MGTVSWAQLETLGWDLAGQHVHTLASLPHCAGLSTRHQCARFERRWSSSEARVAAGTNARPLGCSAGEQTIGSLLAKLHLPALPLGPPRHTHWRSHPSTRPQEAPYPKSSQ